MEEFLGGISIYLILRLRKGGDAVNFLRILALKKRGNAARFFFSVLGPFDHEAESSAVRSM